MFAIDIDDNLSSEDFLCRCKEYDLHPAFLYHTFSSTKAIEKFRAVFVLEKPITDSNIAEFILVLFFEVFPETDNQCKDCSRLFYGGKELFYTDFSAVLDIEKLILAAHARLKQDDSGNFRRKIVNISKKYGLKTNESIFPVYNRKFARELVVLPDDYIWGNLVFKRSGIDEKQNCKKLKKKNKAIKTVLLDQSIMTGIGNIYANEICYQMHLNPYTKANVLSKKRVKELVDVACEILNKAILQGGTTIHSFSANGIDGLFQVQLKVHMQKHCPLGHEIKKVMINERGTYYCPICQKAKR